MNIHERVLRNRINQIQLEIDRLRFELVKMTSLSEIQSHKRQIVREERKLRLFQDELKVLIAAEFSIA